MNLSEYLKSSSKTAFIQDRHKISYEKLIERSLKFGGSLRKKGIGEGSYCLVFLPLSIDLYVALIGSWSIGAIPIFMDFGRGSSFVDKCVERLKPDIIITDKVTSLVSKVYPALRKAKSISINSLDLPVNISSVAPDFPAILTFTSGSTGAPKVAVRTHGFLINQFNVIKTHIDFSERHVDLGTLPVFTLGNLASHMTTLLPPRQYDSRLNPKKIASLVDKYKVTRMIASPALASGLMEHSRLSSLQSAYLGGGPVYPSILGKFMAKTETFIVYGSTEAEPIASIRWADVTKSDKAKINLGEGLIAGKFVPEVNCRISLEKEIQVSGDTVLKGYLDGIGDSENKINEDGTIWHRTGDAGFFDNSNHIWLLGRTNNVIRDEMGLLYPFQAECVLDAHFGIRCATLRVNGERTVIIKKGKTTPEEALEALKHLGIQKVQTVKEIPMDKRHNAKIDYHALMKLLG